MTTITVHHKPSDLLRLGLYSTARSPALRWTLLALAVIVLGINLQQQQSHLNPITLFAIAVTTAIFTGAFLVLMLAVTPFLTLLRNRGRAPAAEIHSYTMTETGLLRKSASSETLLKWGGARSLRKGKAAIYVGISPSSYFILPRHSFASGDDYESFWRSVQRLAPNTSLERAREK